ncbi:fkbM_fam, methyltransferase, FkbM family [Candidatus Nanopelagicaceae bacterium]
MVSLVINTLPTISKVLEQEIQIAQGKGFGSFSTEKEVESALSFIDVNDSKKLVVLDIGANVGDYTAAIIRRVKNLKVYAFEPSSFTFSKLNGKFNKRPEVELINSAIGNQEGKAILWSDKPGSGLASLSHRKLEHFGIEFEENEEITIHRLESWCTENRVHPDLIKIDVEGHELDVLNSGRSVISNSAVVQFEFGGCNIDTRTFFQDFWHFFNDMGFSLYRITPTGPKKVSRYSEHDETFRTTNYLAINPKHPIVKPLSR